MGCGGPSGAEAEGPQQVHQALVTGPDFVVKDVSGPTSSWPGNSFKMKVTVCNQGTVGDSTNVDLFLSSDKAISTADALMGGLFLGWMEPGQCLSNELYVTPSVPDGAWYLGALADSYNGVAESNEANNGRTGALIGIGYGADFVVKEVLAPVSIRPGDSFTATVTVCNQGTQSGHAEALLVLSQDTAIAFDPNGPPDQPDQPVAPVYLGWLEAGQCATQQAQASLYPSQEGPWYLGAVADPSNYEPELIEINNTRASAQVGVGHRPDFVVKELSAPTSIMPGNQFTATLTVCNQGTVGGSTDVQLVLSQDTTITFSPGGAPNQDEPAGGMYVGWLDPGQCSKQPLQTSVYPSQEGPWYLGAVVDPTQYEPELIETNNTRASAQVGIGHGPDFIVKEVLAPTSIRPGDPFTATVTVCNQGTQSGHAEAFLVLSQDALIQFSQDGAPGQDYPLQNFHAGHLEPGQCATQQVQAYLYPSQEGPWYLGAVADPGNYEPELIETNNARASKVVGIGHGPDFIIKEVLAPASIRPGDPFTATVTVCNQGTHGGHTDAALVLSRDTTITFSYDGAPSEQDGLLEHFYPEYLEPGQCRTQQVQSQVHVHPEGPWYLGAVADPGNYAFELIKTNNALASKVVGIGHRPDFIIKEVLAPVSIRPGDPFTATVTVCNQGTQSGHAEAFLVLSRDALIQFSYNTPPSEQDQPLEPLSVGHLEAGQCRTQQVQSQVHVYPEGPWYLGAVADPGQYEQELIETNNTLASKVVGIGHGPDFIVKEVLAPASIRPGETFTTSVTVCNQGTQGGHPQAQLVLSQDTTITFSNGVPGSDQPVGFIHMDPLEPGQCRTQQVQSQVHVYPEGPWYLGAVVDPDNQWFELIETNNALASKVVGIGYRPDYIIKAISAPASIRPGDPFTASVTVCNQGTQGGATEVHLVLSQDITITFSHHGNPAGQDQPVNSFHSGPLEPGQCATQPVEGSVYVPQDGPWYLGAVADAGQYEQELIETNNTRASTVIGIGHRPDYVIKDVSAPASVRPGDPLTVNVTVCNQGTQGGATEVHLVLSEDSLINFSYYGNPELQDQPVNSFHSGPLEPGQCRTHPVPGSVYVPEDGPWYLGAVADAGQYEQELIETNNTRASAVIGIGHQPDYVIKSISAPPSVRPGDPLTVSITTCNQGTTGGSTELFLVLSEDTDIRFSYYGSPDLQDQPLTNFYSEPLEPGQCRTQLVETNVYVPYDGPWYLGVVADPGQYEQELIETNNALASPVIGIGYRPDYIVKEVTAPASVRPGDPLTVNVTVCNQGTSGGYAMGMLLLSRDTTIRFNPYGAPDSEDMPLSDFDAGPLEPGQCTKTQVFTSAYVPHEGPWYVGAVVDAWGYEQELIETNNTRASAVIGIGHGADYIIKDVTAPASIRPGDTFSVSVTVCNQGTQGGATDVELVLSEDSTINFSYHGNPAGQDQPVGFLHSGPLEPGQCTKKQLSTSVSVPQDGPWYLGAVADPGQYELELLETNNTRASKVVGIGHLPDYILKEVVVPASVVPGQQFPVKVTVCNQGTMPGGTYVTLVLSEDTDIRFSYDAPPYTQDMPVAEFFSGPLEPAQCSTQQVYTTVYPPQDGGWYVGAVADPGQSEQELLENNNTRASVLMGVGHAADLIIKDVTAPASLRPGDTFSMAVTVCNQGTTPTPGEVQLVLSEDTDIRFSYNGPPSGQDMPVEFLYVDLLDPGQCTSRTLTLSVYPPREGTWYLGAVADPGQYTQELIETNNTRASKAVSIKY